MTEPILHPLQESAAGGAAIVPRWEWRTFGDGFGGADRRLAARTPAQVRENDDLYILSKGGDASVKVRDGVMDVKRLERVDGDGLELWRPVLKAASPLSVADVATIFTALQCSLLPLGRAGYSFDELLVELVRPRDELLPVRVHKMRSHYDLDGCWAEVTEVRAAGRKTHTLAVESEDPGRLLETVRELGLASRANVCFARGLKALLGFGARRYAVLDVGTNSVKFLVGERRADGVWQTVVDRAEVTRLGEGLGEAGKLSEEPMRRTVEAIAGMVDEAKREGVGGIAAVGTAWMRIASNSETFVDAVQDRCGLLVEVVPGEEEARLAYLAVKTSVGLGQGSLVVFDTGGGSSQFTFGHGERVDERFSVDVGAARFTEDFGLDGVVSSERLTRAFAAIGGDLERLDGRPSPDALVGMGGAITNLAAVKHQLVEYDPDVVQGTVLDRAEIDRQIELYRTHTAEERRAIVGLQPNRAEVILAGACIVRTVLAKLGCEALTVSDRGLRHGLLVERFEPNSGRPLTVEVR
jgi:exopolyphosphatase/guanosine-5'-triphosphate,3'-diphosphate pyrophosphatase